ncbi:APC family permease [Nocardia camponoti]|uniref:Amino acid transporter n=1 Tax=Nocardia camponoti TaxID=1616106 RepID=A0A917V6U1_9NOCA|nr:APC family permease [Nocardia camponoti]GGK45511.1 amino acid transporter [Nocardia camponoti]
MVEALTSTATPPPPPAEPEKLTRSIGVFGGTMLTLSCLTPASSLFVIVPGLLETQGTGAALTLLIAALLCIGVAFCYSELGTLVPSAGGEYASTAKLLGRKPAWLVFAITLVSVLSIPAIMAVGTAQYLAPLFDADPKIVGAGVMLLSLAMGLVHLRTNAWVTGAFLVLEVIAAGIVAVLGFAHTERGLSTLIHPEVFADNAASPMTIGVLISGLAVALFALQGFATAVYLVEEMHQPRRTVVRTVLWTLALGAVVVIVPTIAITLGAPDLAALAGGDLPAMVTAWSSSGLSTFVSLCIALAIVNACVVMVIQNSRVVYASARDQAWPAPVNRALTKVNRLGAPWIATLVVGVPGAALCFVELTVLGEVTSVVIVGMYMAMAIGALVSRRGGHQESTAWRMPLWPTVPILTLIALIYILTQQAPLPLAITAGVIAAAFLYWGLYLRKHPTDRWSIQVPSET